MIVAEEIGAAAAGDTPEEHRGQHRAQGELAAESIGFGRPRAEQDDTEVSCDIGEFYFREGGADPELAPEAPYALSDDDSIRNRR